MTDIPCVVPVCNRHRYEVVREFLADFPLPNGRPSGKSRTYQVIACVNCGYKDSRWKPKSKVNQDGPIA
jgi:hypothetical protein